MPAAAVKARYVLRIPPDNMNHNAEFSLKQQPTYYCYRFPIHKNISLLHARVRETRTSCCDGCVKKTIKRVHMSLMMPTPVLAVVDPVHYRPLSGM